MTTPSARTVAVAALALFSLTFSLARGQGTTAAGALVRLQEPGAGAVLDVAVSPDGTTVATATTRGGVRFRRVSDGSPAGDLQAESSAASIEFTPDGTKLTAVYSDGTVRLWDVRGQEMIRRMLVHPRGVKAAALSPDGRLLAGGGQDGAINVADAETEKPVRRFVPEPAQVAVARVARPGPVRALAFSPDGSFLVSAHEQIDPFVHVWDPSTGREIARLQEDGLGVQSIVFSPDGATLATAADNGQNITLWETATWRARKTLNCTGAPEFPHAFSADGRSLWTVSDEEAWRWDLATGRRLRQFTGEHRRPVAALAAFPTGTRIVTGAADGAAVIWDGVFPQHGKQQQTPPDDGESFRPEGLWGALAGEDAGPAYEAMWALAATPRQAVPYLRNRMPRQMVVDEDKVRQLLAELDHDQFTVRERATRELAQMRDAAEPLLRAHLAATTSPEVIQRIGLLLESVSQSVGDADMLRGLRAVEVLERIATPEATATLEELAQGASSSRLRTRARAAVQRLTRFRDAPAATPTAAPTPAPSKQ